MAGFCAQRVLGKERGAGGLSEDRAEYHFEALDGAAPGEKILC